MSKLYKLYIYLGRVLWPLQLPLMRFFIKRTRRVYLIIRDGDQILMTRNWLSDGCLALPGGGMARSESPEEALVRELAEEIGVKINPQEIKHVVSGVWRTHGLGFKYDIYSTKTKPSIGHVRRFEITDVRWVKIEDLNKDNVAKEVLDAIGSI